MIINRLNTRMIIGTTNWITFEVVLPLQDEICPITFHNDDIYGLPYIKHIPAHTPIGRQLPTPVLRQQWILGIGTEEPIHATSALEECNRLRLSHGNDTISLTMALVLLKITTNMNLNTPSLIKCDQSLPLSPINPLSLSLSLPPPHQVPTWKP